MAYRITIIVSEYGRSEEAMERFFEAFDETHPEVGAAIGGNAETGELTVTFSVEAVDFDEVSALAPKVFSEAAQATGLEPTQVLSAHLDRIADPEDARELQPA